MAEVFIKLACFVLISIHFCDGLPTNDAQDQDELYHQLSMFSTSFNISLDASRLTQFSEVDIKSPTGAMIEAYFENSNSGGLNMGIKKIFSLKRKHEREIYAQRLSEDESKEGTRLLVWHGTRMDNLKSVLEHGFQLPGKWDTDGSQFVLTMHSMFGAGIFFADRSSKSAGYTNADSDGVLLLCEVALGETLKATEPQDFSRGPNGYDSVTAIGKRIPHRNGTLTFESAFVPAGTTIQHPKMSTGIRTHPYHNEYVVFDTTRILIKFIVQIKWK